MIDGHSVTKIHSQGDFRAGYLLASLSTMANAYKIVMHFFEYALVIKAVF